MFGPKIVNGATIATIATNRNNCNHSKSTHSNFCDKILTSLFQQTVSAMDSENQKLRRQVEELEVIYSN